MHGAGKTHNSHAPERKLNGVPETAGAAIGGWTRQRRKKDDKVRFVVFFISLDLESQDVSGIVVKRGHLPAQLSQESLIPFVPPHPSPAEIGS